MRFKVFTWGTPQKNTSTLSNTHGIRRPNFIRLCLAVPGQRFSTFSGGFQIFFGRQKRAARLPQWK
jgi:hypothetical protein